VCFACILAPLHAINKTSNFRGVYFGTHIHPAPPPPQGNINQYNLGGKYEKGNEKKGKNSKEKQEVKGCQRQN
jgi:hypothetical protein